METTDKALIAGEKGFVSTRTMAYLRTQSLSQACRIYNVDPAYYHYQYDDYFGQQGMRENRCIISSKLYPT